MADDFKIELINNTDAVKEALNCQCQAFLIQAGQILKSQVRDLTRVKTGKTKNSWDYSLIDKGGDQSVQVGSPLENAIWEEFGTGEYALEGNGRKGGWFYVNDDNEKVFTRGKKPSRALYYACKNAKPVIKQLFEDTVGGMFKK